MTAATDIQSANDQRSGHSLQRLVSRRAFEDWITAPPYERDTYRWPMEETKYAWPGQYKDIAVQLAWEAWCEAANEKLCHCAGEAGGS